MDDFFAMMAAVLMANLLTVCFVYGMIRFDRIEKADPKGSSGLTELGLILMTLAFLAYGVWAAGVWA